MKAAYPQVVYMIVGLQIVRLQLESVKNFKDIELSYGIYWDVSTNKPITISQAQLNGAYFFINEESAVRQVLMIINNWLNFYKERVKTLEDESNIDRHQK